MEAFERTGTQMRYFRQPGQVSLHVAQMHRALAKLERKAADAEEAIHLDLDKGVRSGPGLRTDWWTRMLGQLFRMTEECRRALVAAHPDPLALMDRLLAQDPGEAMQALARLQTQSGRFVGPVLAQKVYLCLTSLDGKQVMDKCES